MNDWKTEKKRLKLLFKFVKFTNMQESLAGQVFLALDQDRDGVLSREDFITGCLRMARGGGYEKAAFIFTVLDFTHKGFLTPQDLLTLQSSLPSPCPLCDSTCPFPAILTSQSSFLYIENPSALYESYRDIYDHFLLGMLLQLPAVLMEALSLAPAEPVTELRPLFSGSIKYMVTINNKAMYAYGSAEVPTLKQILYLGDLFLSPDGDTSFQLKSRDVTYTFTAESSVQRDEWIDRIIAQQEFRWFDDSYKAKEKVGDGASGTVLRAESRIEDRQAAVKIVDKQRLDWSCETRLRREINILRTLLHPNVLRFYDVFETYERAYIVTELISEGTLFEFLEARKFQVSEDFAKQVVSDIATGLQYLHERGIVHRDLKLENIMMRKDEQGQMHAVIIDFGLSICLGPKETAREPVGTLKYAAPEIITHLKYREKVDCWSLGVILYILLQGKVPFYGKCDREVAVHILKRHIQYFGEKWGEVSPEAIEVVSGLLLRKAEQRWSVRDVLASDWLQCRSETCGFVSLEAESMQPAHVVPSPCSL